MTIFQLKSQYSYGIANQHLSHLALKVSHSPQGNCCWYPCRIVHFTPHCLYIIAIGKSRNYADKLRGLNTNDREEIESSVLSAESSHNGIAHS